MLSKISLCLIIAFAFTLSPLYAGVVEPDYHSNSFRVYGWVFDAHRGDSSAGYATVFLPSEDNVVRLDYTGNGNGVKDLVSGQYTVIHGHLEGRLGCVDGTNSIVVPDVVWRWIDASQSWEIFDHDLQMWIAWP